MAQTLDTPGWPDAESVEVPGDVLGRLQDICGRLPDVHRDGSSWGARWLIRKRTFLTVRTRRLNSVLVSRLQFRSPEPEFHFLIEAGPPFARAGWGGDVVNMYLDDATDWDEVSELVTESYCVMAPKRLAATVRQDNASAGD